jgi:mannose-1-phosphate guanylyltransferase/mannose-1-phosphate guanylyltransferase/mannose-6-phosphate isomerase
MFLFPVALLRREMTRHAPAILAAAEKAVSCGARDRDFLRLYAEAFAASPATSIDYAVMERTDRAAVVPSAFGWSDVGAWSALWEIGTRDDAGNVVLGDVLTQDTRNSYLRSDGKLLAAIGLDDAVVVALKDAVLVARRDRVQDVKAIVDRLKADRRSEASAPARVPRPWGSYESIETGSGFQVKRIVVDPGQKISLQKHAKRAEHWVVVRGTARVTCESVVRTLEPNMSAYIPVGAVHRLENVGEEKLHVIEVQCGSYLGEDDIVRLSDDFGRA